ncbi:MAG: hypothetical protein B5M53_09075 [Candidatus Cloacimonas sp. 4484_209]|nr:MAG: hypothetical protein B5M53_09075 [Candidatus Cloacimonas sp. 4484_209]
MSPAKKISYFFILFIFIFIGCAHLPTSEHPMEINKVFHASFDKTWDSVLEVVKTSKGIIITKDKSSGLIVYKLKSQIYTNVYLKDSPSTNTTVVYVVPWVKSGHFSEEIEEHFFKMLEKNLTKK